MKYDDVEDDFFLLNRNVISIKRNNEKIVRDLHQISEDMTSQLSSLKRGRNPVMMIDFCLYYISSKFN